MNHDDYVTNSPQGYTVDNIATLSHPAVTSASDIVVKKSHAQSESTSLRELENDYMRRIAAMQMESENAWREPENPTVSYVVPYGAKHRAWKHDDVHKINHN